MNVIICRECGADVEDVQYIERDLRQTEMFDISQWDERPYWRVSCATCGAVGRHTAEPQTLGDMLNDHRFYEAQVNLPAYVRAVFRHTVAYTLSANNKR